MKIFLFLYYISGFMCVIMYHGESNRDYEGECVYEEKSCGIAVGG